MTIQPVVAVNDFYPVND